MPPKKKLKLAIEDVEKKFKSAVRKPEKKLGSLCIPIQVNSSPYQVAFIGTRGTSWQSNMAIDQVELIPGICGNTGT